MLITVLCAGMVMAYAPAKSNSYKDKPMTVEKLIGPDTELPAPDGLGPGSYAPLNTDDPIGDVFQFGTSWYDIQHNGTCGRQLHVDSDGYVHMVWMNGLITGASLRHIYYQLMDPLDQLIFTEPSLGIQVDQSPRSGYTVMEVYSDNRAMPCFHQGNTINVNYHTALAFDYFPRVGAFQAQELPWVYEGADDLEVIWPRMDMDIDGKFHIISTENPASGVAGDPQRIYYSRVAFDPTTYTMTNETPQQVVMDTVMVIASDIAASPVSNRVVAGWMQMDATTGEGSQYDNDVILCISEDGVTWDWTDTINVTNWIPSDLSVLPGEYATELDTMVADRDTLRAYTDMNVFIDSNDEAHVVFSTRGYYDLEGSLSWGNGHILHWSESNPEITMVANGWFHMGYFDAGAWNVYTQRPSLGEDSETGYLYCMYQRYLNPNPNGATFEYYPDALMPDFIYSPEAVTVDMSSSNWMNGDVWITVSTDGGASWSEGTNVTNTPSPGATAGYCMSELTPSMAPDVVNGYCHVFYILDKDAGAVVQTEGTWTLNDAVYHRVPISEIPTTPLNPSITVHVDATVIAPTIRTFTPTGIEQFNLNVGQQFTQSFTLGAIDPLGVGVDYLWTLETLGNIYLSNLGTGNASAGYGFFITNIDTLAYEDILNIDMTFDEEADYRLVGWAFNEKIGNYHEWYIAVGAGSADAGDQEEQNVPEDFSLQQNYPNPFNPETSIEFSLNADGYVSLKVYNVAGEEVASVYEGQRNAGNYTEIFDGSELTSGVYFYTLKMNGFSQTKKMILMK